MDVHTWRDAHLDLCVSRQRVGDIADGLGSTKTFTDSTAWMNTLVIDQNANIVVKTETLYQPSRSGDAEYCMISDLTMSLC